MRNAQPVSATLVQLPLVAALALLLPPAVRASFIDVTSVSSGNPGAFTGTLGGGVTGSLTGPAGFSIQPVMNGNNAFEFSTTDGSSPQYSYGNIYTPSQAFADRIGYAMQNGTTGTATLTITFATPITNPVFHVANLDSMTFDFSPTVSAANLFLLSGNGGGGDGLVLTGTLLADADPTTVVPHPADSSPPTTGARSGYGSVQLVGTFSQLDIILAPNVGAIEGDGGSFQISQAVPEPSSLALAGFGILGLAGAAWRRRKVVMA